MRYRDYLFFYLFLFSLVVPLRHKNKIILYFYLNQNIYLYDVEGQLKKIKIDKKINNLYISLKNNYIFIHEDQLNQSLIYLYSLY